MNSTASTALSDGEIVELYFSRNEQAIEATDQKYRAYLYRIAYSFLRDSFDSEEAVTDTYLGAWGAIPPHKPASLKGFLAKIVRRVSATMYKKRMRQKRVVSEFTVSIDELYDCFGADEVESEIDTALISESLNKFLRSQPEQSRNIFILRYYYAESHTKIAKIYRLSESAVYKQLAKMRKDLKSALQREGIDI